MPEIAAARVIVRIEMLHSGLSTDVEISRTSALRR
jgi:hypothetical protein